MTDTANPTSSMSNPTDPAGPATAGAGAPEVRASGLGRVFTTNDGLHRPALHDVDLVIPPAQFVSIIGASGCGKSTLLRLVGGLDRPTSGTITVGNEDPSVVRGRGVIGLVPQSPALLPWRSVADNVALLDQLGPWKGRRVDANTVRRWLERVQLAGEHDLLPHQLSGGMQQRVALARAFAIEPSLLLMDEPFNALDEVTRHHMQTLLVELWRLRQATVVFVTHSIDEAVKLSDRVVVLGGKPGTVAAEITIDLARPRESGIEDTQPFRRHAAAIRRVLIGDTGPNGEPDAAINPGHEVGS